MLDKQLGYIEEKDVKKFNTDGFVKVKGLFPSDVIDSIINEIETSEILKTADGVIYDLIDNKKELRYAPRPHVIMPCFQKLVNSNVLYSCSKLLNEQVYFVGIDLHSRAAGTFDPTPPHQDSFLFCFEPGYESLLTCYIGLTDMEEGSANLRFIKGSHLQPTLDHKKSAIRGFSSVIEESSDLLSSDLLNNEEIITLKAGEAVFFHSKTIHYTNQTVLPKKNRTAVAIRVGGYNVRYSKERQEKYKEYVAFNRSQTINEGLTSSIPKPQHI